MNAIKKYFWISIDRFDSGWWQLGVQASLHRHFEIDPYHLEVFIDLIWYVITIRFGQDE